MRGGRWTNRRRFGVGAAGAVASLSGAAVLLATRALGNESSPPDPTQPALAVENQPPTAVAGVSNVPNAAPTVIRSALQAAVPNGMALVSSPRLPLFDLASQDVGALVSGQLPSWIEVGFALDLAVAPVAINGVTMDGLAAGDFADYEELATTTTTTLIPELHKKQWWRARARRGGARARGARARARAHG